MTRAIWKRTTVVIVLVGLATCSLRPATLCGQTAGGWGAVPTRQANGGRMQTPLDRPVSRQSKLSLTVDTRWANNYGYRPIDVTISSPTPTIADHLVTVRLHSGWRGTVNVDQSFEMPLGSTSATMTVAVPRYQSSGQYLWWEVWINGIKDKDLSLRKEDTIRRFGGNLGTPTGLSFLAAEPPVPGDIEGGSQRALVAPSSFQFEVFSLWLSEFPRRWIDYTCLDVAVLSWSELQLLSQTNAAGFEALLRWVRAGGQLWVSEVGDELGELSKLSKLLGVRVSIAPAVKQGVIEPTIAESADDSLDAGWQPVRLRSRRRDGREVTFLDINTGQNRVTRNPDAIARLENDPNFVVTSERFEAREEDESERRWPRETSAWFVEQRLGLGFVRAFREASEIALFSQRLQPANSNATGSEESGDRLPRSLSTALRTTDSWAVRHGIAPDDVSRDFANLLVPDVGLAPVTEFRVLITLFVVLIGPVNYWLLKRSRRLHLLVLTVPLAAGLMTAALFAYAIVSDGLGTTVRAHSFTKLDQRTGEAACWARISYYSGLAPGSGLVMPADVALYPINPAWNAGSYNGNQVIQRDLTWQGDTARLKRGWLRSRSPTQYLALRSRNSPHRLELASGGGKLRATNRLGTAIELVLVVDRANKLWVGEALAADSVAYLKPIERTEAIRRFRQLVTENEPQLPAALSDDDSHYSAMQRRQWYRSGFGFQQNEVRLATSLVNEDLAELAGLAGRPALALPPRSYVAVTATGPEVALGLRGAKEDASFHVLVGQW